MWELKIWRSRSGLLRNVESDLGVEGQWSGSSFILVLRHSIISWPREFWDFFRFLTRDPFNGQRWEWLYMLQETFITKKKQGYTRT